VKSGSNGIHKNKDFSYSKFKITILFFAVFTVITVPLVSSDAFANHLSEKMKWQIVFISSQPGCANYHYQMMNRFHSVTGAYLNEYGIENESYPPECIPIKKYPQEYEEHYDIDLFVLIYDRNLGREILQEQDIGGFYNHYGTDRTTNHVIVFCDCPNFNFSDPVWILSHELSHFSLVYLGYEPSIIETLVHQNDEAYDKCREDWHDGCESIIKKLSGDKYGYEFSVMPIYQPTIEGNKTSFQPKEISDEILEVSKLLTLWWGLGQPIDDLGYAKAIRLLGSNGELGMDYDVIEFNDDPISDELTWEELLYGESVFNSTEISPHIPFGLKSQSELDAEFENRLSTIPDWFKETASWWANGEISDEEFSQSINFLKEEGSIDPEFDIRFLFKVK